MSSVTSRAGLHKPATDGSENVNVATDLDDNWDKIDQYLGFMDVPDHAARLAVVGFVGLCVRQADTGALYVQRATPGNADGAWKIVAPQPEPVATQAARDAFTNLYVGRSILRTDRNWVEVYDGAGWRIQGIPVVANVGDLAAITSPYGGQLAWSTGDSKHYAYVSGAWQRADWPDPWGVLVGKRRTSGANYSIGIGGTEALTNMDTGNVNVLSGRRYKINAKLKLTGTVNSDTYQLLLRENSLTGTQRGEYVWWCPTNVYGFSQPLVSFEYIPAANAVINFVLSAKRLGGTGSLSVNGGLDSNTTFLEVEDCGLASVMTTA